MKVRTGLLAIALMVGISASAAAQGIPWEDAVFVNVNFGGQTGSQTISGSQQIPLYGETGNVEYSREVKGGGIFDITAGVPVYGKLGAAASLTLRSKPSDATVTGSVPDSVGFDFRPVSATVPDLEHKETWLSFMAVGVLPAAEKIDVFIMGGPAIVWVQHALVGNITVNEPGPTLTVPTTLVKKTVAGFVIGGDVRYMFNEYIGAGGFIRFTTASADMSDTVKLDLGGFQIGAGIRFRY